MYGNNFISRHDDDIDDSHALLSMLRANNKDSLFLLSSERFEDKVKLYWPPPFQACDNHIFVMGSSINDTLCLYQILGWSRVPEILLKVVLWNPTTKEFKVIPTGSVECPLGVDIYVTLEGFGYDIERDDYKLIRCASSFDFVGEVPVVLEPIWQIYRLRSNSGR